MAACLRAMSLFGQQMLLVTNGVFPSNGLASPNTEHRASTESRRCNNTNADGDFEKITGVIMGTGKILIVTTSRVCCVSCPVRSGMKGCGAQQDNTW